MDAQYYLRASEMTLDRAEDGAKTGVALALLDANGPTGTFSESGEVLPR
ncbi:hypothetical protein [Mucilaginibacter sp. OK098]|nr:hypothetical protein [Mucilaginibacter sp. OK098]